MLDDQSIWNTIGGKNKFCSFRMKTDTEVSVCRNVNNLTGLCNKASCPLANSKYVTIRSIEDKLYLCIKESERQHKPESIYERILLSDDYNAALEQIEKELKGFSKFYIHKCKQRLTKLTEYLERKELLETIGRERYIKRRRKAERQDRAREIKAVRVADIEKNIEKEILERYELGVYKNKTLIEQEVRTEKELKRDKELKKQKKGIKYVVEFEEKEEEKEKKKRKIGLSGW